MKTSPPNLDENVTTIAIRWLWNENFENSTTEWAVRGSIYIEIIRGFTRGFFP